MNIHEEQKRLRILEEDEIETLYGRPRFTHEERRSYFAISQPEKELLQLFRSVKSQAYCDLTNKFTQVVMIYVSREKVARIWL